MMTKEHTTKASSYHNRGFSLVEVSVVLVIIAVLLASITAGMHLIRQAEIKTVITETEGYKQAVSTFREIYFSWPGDMPNATDFWASTEDGDDDQQIIGDTGGPTTNEGYRAWQHLSLANTIKGSFNGVSASGDEALIGENVPAASITGGGYFFHYWGLAADKNNAITLGAFDSGTYNFNPALPPRDAEFIDRKTDDGQPRSGDVWAGGNGGVGDCYTGTAYNLMDETVQCTLHFWLDAN